MLQFHIIDDKSIFPSEKLSIYSQAFAMAGWRDNADITQFPLIFGWLDCEHLVAGTDADQKVCPHCRRCAGHQRCKLMGIGKTTLVQLLIGPGKQR